MTKKDKIKVYDFIINYLENEKKTIGKTIGLCSIIYNNNLRKGYNSKKIHWKHYFPELYVKKPSKELLFKIPNTNRSYWYDPTDIDIRIKIIKELKNELQSII